MSHVDCTEPCSFAELNFAGAELGDVRRTARLVQVVEQICRHPGGSLPDKLASPADLKALYRLCEREEVTHAAIFRSIRQQTQTRLAQHEGVVLVLHDATELDYSQHATVADEMGQIGNGSRRGYVCHNSLAVDAQTREIIGLTNQILHCRVKAPAGEKVTQRRARQSRESRLWVRGTESLPSDWNLVDVCDRGADTFEFLDSECCSGRRFVIRSRYSRKMYVGQEPGGKRHNLQAYLRGLTSSGCQEVEVPAVAARGKKARKKRVAKLLISFAAVCLDRPHVKHGEHGDQPLPVFAIRVWEPHPPRGEQGLEWFLLTNQAVTKLADALLVIDWYKTRWVIEEFHKAMKTGCNVEQLQFNYVDRLEPMIAVLSAVATTLLNLRALCATAECETRPASTVIAKEYVELISRWRYHALRNLSVREFCLALGRLGGHQNRKHDGLPGWLTLWRGWTKLQAMLDGAEFTRQQKRCG
jgi:hypothetical protein